ncbi:hypothetical protein [Streptomyces cavernicola]|uniref:DUF4395 domain-containing protein n=1 Tax=Streptomyces cavernicola TaxID=3043613 RepID=A0ABT6S9A4_9ACTN|nr:hypothetical protein [Streptomyces sp. B-S-A6]MDI3404690.1 hypothetical protein [Streptomyces sp. B-S-A6]
MYTVLADCGVLDAAFAYCLGCELFLLLKRGTGGRIRARTNRS